MNNFLKKEFTIKNGILTFEIKEKKTQEVTDFYTEKPFPNYKDNDNKQTILNKGNKNFLASQFKKFMGYKKNVLEVGCGTGQLSNYFAIGTNNNIVVPVAPMERIDDNDDLIKEIDSINRIKITIEILYWILSIFMTSNLLRKLN